LNALFTVNDSGDGTPKVSRGAPCSKKFCNPNFISQDFLRFSSFIHNIYFTKNLHILKASCTFQYNYQATGLKKYEITTIDLKTTNPYLPDRVEFRHQFVKFKAGNAIYIKKNVLTLSIICWWRGGYVRV
jgi:hypothetical protein